MDVVQLDSVQKRRVNLRAFVLGRKIMTLILIYVSRSRGFRGLQKVDNAKKNLIKLTLFRTKESRSETGSS
jgi:hypothetical protein